MQAVESGGKYARSGVQQMCNESGVFLLYFELWKCSRWVWPWTLLSITSRVGESVIRHQPHLSTSHSQAPRCSKSGQAEPRQRQKIIPARDVVVYSTSNNAVSFITPSRAEALFYLFPGRHPLRFDLKPWSPLPYATLDALRAVSLTNSSYGL